ncbi:DUF2202 domain-containing protein [Sulfurimonas sp. HSL-3221]|uniref:DUF2202 domain-containing protein n=1 Tax=Sulfurimonadaceae TaxID=2771471 RepID=UPI001E4480AA|nr:DUF2202 domain-containing protein [Sulfurimonas sp. HSL-3221]UFS61846.1 DUF2202 domain-containing protein [Sulfurimonas sp. HSL-3221]
MINARREFLGKVAKTGAVLLAGGATVLHANGSAKSDTDPVLSDDQRDTLFYIYQEEKVARDVYITLGERYPEESTFALIQLSEQSHIEAVGALCVSYGIDISYVDLDAVGVFELPALQNLYDACVAQGNISRLEGLKVGELIELTDLDDLESAAAGMPEDVVSVFENLKEGSESHLDAFRRAIARLEA